MRIHILCISKRPRGWAAQATEDYLRRMQGQVDIKVSDIAPMHQSAKASQLKKESERLRRLSPDRAHKIALDERGQQWSTLELAAEVDRWQSTHADVVCYIGGAEGLAQELLDTADQRWSLSRLTLPHQLVRVVLVEQLYRAWSVLQNHPYHRA